jgi:tetratricopeptide (TPR) repeat protein
VATKFLLAVCALCLVAVSIARPVLPPRSNEGKQSGTEFFIILDVSKSMLVRDVEPNRLEAVKESLLNWLKTRAGDRIGLILMAGDSFVQAPLTHDLTALRGVLAQSGPASISRGGSHIAGAIETAANALEKSGAKNKIAVLISDGGSTEGQAMESLQKARSISNLTLFTVGVGTASGGPVPTAPAKGKSEDFSKPPPGGYVIDEYGKRATSRLDERSLRLLASAGGGRYFAFDSEGDVWNRLYTQALQPYARQMDASNLKDYRDLFQLPLLAAIVLLAYQAALSTRLKNPLRLELAVTLPDGGAAPTATKMNKMNSQSLPLLLIFTSSLLASVVCHASPTTLTAAEAQKMVKDGKAAEAAKSLWDAAQKDPENYYLIYNFGVASYAMSNFSDAVNAFSEAALSKDETLRAMALVQLGNAQYRMGQSLKKSGNEAGSIIAWERAVEYYESSLAEHSDSTSRHNLGIARVELEGLLIETGDKALKLGSTSPQLERRIALFGSALEKFEKAADLNPSNKAASTNVEEARKLLSESLVEQARLNRAEAVKVSADPKKAPLQAELNVRASQNYEKAVELAPDNKPLAAEYAEFKKSVADEFSNAAEALLNQSADLGAQKGEAGMNKQESFLNQAVEKASQAIAFDESNERAKGILAKSQSELEKILDTRGDLFKDSGDKAATNSAAAAQAQKSADDAGKNKEAAGKGIEAATQARLAAAQYGKAAEDYRKALGLSPDNAGIQSKLEDVEGKLAAALSKAAEGEMNAADSNPASKNTPSDGKPGEADKAGTEQLQSAIGHLEKAVAMLDQAEALAPGKNQAAALAEKAAAKLAEKRGELDKAQGKNQEGSGKDTAGKGEKGQNGEDSNKPGEGTPAGATDVAMDVNNPLNFSDIRKTSGEAQGQFIDKTKKERIRDW